MRTRESLVSIILRLVIAFILLFAVFYYFDPFNALKRETDTINFIIFGLYAPFFITTFTIAICLIFALPFWFSPKLKSWWNSKPLLQILILSLGIILLIISLNNYFRIPKSEPTNGQIISVSFANELISLPGWFIVAISILIIDISGISNKLYDKIMKDTDWTKSPNR